MGGRPDAAARSRLQIPQPDAARHQSQAIEGASSGRAAGLKLPRRETYGRCISPPSPVRSLRDRAPGPNRRGG